VVDNSDRESWKRSVLGMETDLEGELSSWSARAARLNFNNIQASAPAMLPAHSSIKGGNRSPAEGSYKTKRREGSNSYIMN